MAEPAVRNEPSPRVRKKRLRRRDEILQAALRAFREQGYHGTTLEEIAGRLGLRKTALYHYFADKEAILYECHRRSLDELERVMEEAGGMPGPAARLRFLIREHVRVMTEVLEGSPLAFEVPALSADHQAEVVARRDAWEGFLRRTVREGVEAGEFRDVDPRVATFSILGAINWIARWYRPGGDLRPPELAVRFSDHLVTGLTCRRDGRSPGTGPPSDTLRFEPERKP